MTEREFATDVVRKLRDAGYQALWAGGCVRDELLGHAPQDYDVATDARPDQVQRLFRRTVAVGASFGVVEVLGPRGPDGDWLTVQVATFRTDVSYSDGRRPDAVTFCSPQEDAARRDFTINGIFLDPLTGEVIDYVGGRDDLAAHVLRAIGDPAERFREDKLRLLRAARFATRFAMTVEPATAAAVRAMAPQLTVVSAERIAEELRKLLTDPRRGDGVRLMTDLGLAEPVFPGLPGRPEWPHSVAALGMLAPDASFPLALAVLLVPLGRKGADAACRRLKLSNDERERVAWLVEHHASLHDAATMRASRLKPLLAHPGAGELLALHRADAEAAGRDVGHVELCERLLWQWSADGSLNPPPLVTGDDLTALGMEPGPSFKRLLDAVRAAQLDGEITTREEGIALVRRLAEASPPAPPLRG
jgi:poly(A) polymerase